MALQFSSRVTKNMAAQMCAGRENDTTATSSRIVIAIISNSSSVAVPTSASGMFNYLNSCLNASAFGGTAGAGANLPNLLGLYYFPDINTGALEFGQNGNIITYTGPTTITALQSGTIGSVIVYAPNLNTTTSNGTGSTTQFPTSQSALNTAIAGSNISLPPIIPSATSSTNYNTYAATYFRNISFVTDSVGTASSSAVVKFNTLSTTQGQTFTLSGINLKVSSFN